MDQKIPNILCDLGDIGNRLSNIFWYPENSGNLKSPTFSVILEIRAASKRLLLLWFPSLFFFCVGGRSWN